MLVFPCLRSIPGYTRLLDHPEHYFCEEVGYCTDLARYRANADI